MKRKFEGSRLRSCVLCLRLHGHALANLGQGEPRLFSCVGTFACETVIMTVLLMTTFEPLSEGSGVHFAHFLDGTGIGSRDQDEKTVSRDEGYPCN